MKLRNDCGININRLCSKIFFNVEIVGGVMVFGRLLGWALIGLAILMASGDAVMALAPGDHMGIVTGDVWLLLAGHRLPSENLPPSLWTILSAWPAWALIAPMGISLLLLSRPRRRRFRFRPAR